MRGESCVVAALAARPVPRATGNPGSPPLYIVDDGPSWDDDLTSRQASVFVTQGERLYPYCGIHHALDTSLWWDGFIHPAIDWHVGYGLRIYVAPTELKRYGGTSSMNGTIVAGDPALDVLRGLAPMILFNVRRGQIPADPVLKALWRPNRRRFMGEIGRLMPVPGEKEMKWDGWRRITGALLQRGAIRLTKPLEMLLGTEG